MVNAPARQRSFYLRRCRRGADPEIDRRAGQQPWCEAPWRNPRQWAESHSFRPFLVSWYHGSHPDVPPVVSLHSYNWESLNNLGGMSFGLWEEAGIKTLAAGSGSKPLWGNSATHCTHCVALTGLSTGLYLHRLLPRLWWWTQTLWQVKSVYWVSTILHYIHSADTFVQSNL